MKNILLIFLFSVSFLSYAQQTGSIVGKLTDKEFNNEPLPFANVTIKGTTKGATTDADGLYEIDNLDPGTYTVVFSFVGYETIEIEAEVVAEKVTTINVPMGASAAALDEVVIQTTARRDSPAALLIDQKKAVAIKTSIGSFELARKGISDASGAVAKISGISKQRGGGNVYVRGLGDRYQNTTLNGITLPSTDVNKKNIDLGLFSTDIIESIGVSKAYSTNFLSDFSAGNVNIVSKAHTGKNYFNVSVGSGVNSAAIGEDFLLNEGVSYFGRYNRYDNNPFAIVLGQPVDPVDGGAPVNVNFGIEGGFTHEFNERSRISFFGTASFSNGFRFRQGEATNFTNTINSSYPNVDQYIYDATTTAMANIDYRVNDNLNLKYRTLYINSAVDQTEFFGIEGQGDIRDDQGGAEEGFFVYNGRFNQDQIFVNQFLGDYSDGNWKVDWGFGYNKVLADEPDRKRFVLQNYQLALDNDPNTNPTFFSNVAFDNQRFFQEIEDDEYNGFLNLKNTISENVTLNFGYAGRRKVRNFNAIRYGYDLINGNNQVVTDVNNLNSIFNISNINIPDGSGLWNTATLNPIPGQSTINRPGLPDSRYRGELNVHAGHINAEIQLADKKLLIVPGLRIESFDQEITYDVQGDVIAAGVETTVDAYDNLYLPSLNIRYALNDDMNLRGSFSITASFPEFKEVAPFVYEDVVIRYGGNPDLLGGVDGTGPIYSEIFNYDLKYEWFLEPGEIISLGIFYKEINDPINRVTARDATGDQRYFRTGDQAQVFGIEVEARKDLIRDADEDPILNVGFNFAWTDTQQDLKSVGGTFSTQFSRIVNGQIVPRTESELEGASEFIGNLDLTFTPKIGNYKPKASLVGSYFSDRIFALGAGTNGDIIEESVTSLDFVLINPITDNFEIGLTARNLLNPNITFSQTDGLGNSFVITEFKDGIDIGLSLKYKF
ncbi:TonB-dependent receptor [Winogradskyella sp.]|uniref:TonB-dependent receptor n=1 Tax=Winogradskyella sp. TaxID=1883156 RepID=UPI00260CFC40|nr:TonB-dependent receptor [Winogradskyella sp.]